MERNICTTSNPKALDTERTMLEAIGGAKTHLRSKVVKEKTKKPIIMQYNFSLNRYRANDLINRCLMGKRKSCHGFVIVKSKKQ